MLDCLSAFNLADPVQKINHTSAQHLDQQQKKRQCAHYAELLRNYGTICKIMVQLWLSWLARFDTAGHGGKTVLHGSARS